MVTVNRTFTRSRWCAPNSTYVYLKCTSTMDLIREQIHKNKKNSKEVFDFILALDHFKRQSQIIYHFFINHMRFFLTQNNKEMFDFKLTLDHFKRYIQITCHFSINRVWSFLKFLCFCSQQEIFKLIVYKKKIRSNDSIMERWPDGYSCFLIQGGAHKNPTNYFAVANSFKPSIWSTYYYGLFILRKFFYLNFFYFFSKLC